MTKIHEEFIRCKVEDLKKIKIYDKKIEIIIFDKFKKKKPILGICVGFQVLFEKSEESLGVKGLSLLNGSFKKFKPFHPI